MPLVRDPLRDSIGPSQARSEAGSTQTQIRTNRINGVEEKIFIENGRRLFEKAMGDAPIEPLYEKGCYW